MKGSKELKHYIAKNRDMLKAYHYDDMRLFKLQDNCKNEYKRTKQINMEEFDDDIRSTENNDIGPSE